MTAWLLVAFLAPAVLLIFWAFVWDFDRLCADVERRLAYADRRLARSARATEDLCWTLRREADADHARDLHLARTAPAMVTLPHARAKFMVRDTLRIVQ